MLEISEAEELDFKEGETPENIIEVQEAQNECGISVSWILDLDENIKKRIIEELEKRFAQLSSNNWDKIREIIKEVSKELSIELNLVSHTHCSNKEDCSWKVVVEIWQIPYFKECGLTGTKPFITVRF